MGDRCYLTLYWKTSDTKKFLKALNREGCGDGLDPSGYFDEIDQTEPTSRGSVEEANYAWCAELTRIAKRGIVFHGNHSEGGEYGPFVFVSWGGRYYENETDRDTTPTVGLDDDGNPFPNQLAQARRYLWAIKKAAAYCQKKVA